MSSKQTLPADILSAFCLEVSMLLKSGMPIADGIRMVLNEENSKTGTENRENICHRLGMGTTFCEALKKTECFHT